MTRFLLACLLLASCALARADTALSLFKSFSGKYNFTGTTETLRVRDNNYPCSLVSNSSGVYATLKGVPSGAKIESAQLYWAGSGTTYDYTVTFDGVTVTAPANRQYSSRYAANGTYYTYFSGAADVTSQVQKKGNGTYTFSGLTVSTGNPWCSVQGVVGGFALVVVYSHPSEVFRMLNVYEGFQSFRNNSLTITLSGFNVPNPLPTGTTGRIGHVTWEGDTTLSQGGEDLLFNGYEMTDSMNPSGNQFNSASNIIGDATTYGIDFDAYTVKYPVIQAGQTSATTTYRSGQDLVLLSTEIAAIPYSAIADLTLSMARSGTLTVGSVTDYTITVNNLGVDAETGPVTVTDILPAGLNPVKAGGTGWSCSSSVNASSQTVMTCTQAGPVASGAKLPPLTISVTPARAGSYTNTATVTGKTGDPNTANNTASNTSSAVDTTAPANLGTVVLTREVCAIGLPIVTAPGDAGCHRFIGPFVAGDTTTKVYMTYVTGTPQKTSTPPSAPTTVSVTVRATCVPNSGVTIGYAGVTLDCKGTWQTVSLSGGYNQATAVLPADSLLVYADVGRVTLETSSNAVGDAVSFISRPYDVRFKDVLRASDSYPDQYGTSTTIYNNVAWPYAKNDAFAFAKSGEQFILRLGALMADKKSWAPSFGKEQTALKGVLPDDQLDLDLRFDLFAATPQASASVPTTPVVDPDGVIDGVARDAFAIDQGFTPNTSIAGMLDARVRWFEAGYLGITPYLVDYLGTGAVGGPPDGVAPGDSARLVGSTRVVGRFYPDHFETRMDANFACAAGMNCPAVSNDPAVTTYPVSGASYSLQPFSLGVKAYGLPRNGKPSLLSLFRHLSTRPITLAVYSQPNANTAPAGGPFTIDPDNKLKYSSGVTDFPDLKGKATYKLGNAYSATAPAAMTGPTPIYLRATMPDSYQAINGTTTVRTNITVGSSTTAPGQYEGGLMVVNGRLLVGNVFGSELLRLPVPLTVQYWSGKSWVANDKDGDSIVASSLSAVSCTKSFASTAAGACKPGVINMVTPAGGVRVKDGAASVVLQSPGRGNVGSIDFTAGGNAAWLPSTVARATFGLFKSPVIYIREVY